MRAKHQVARLTGGTELAVLYDPLERVGLDFGQRYDSFVRIRFDEGGEDTTLLLEDDVVAFNAKRAATQCIPKRGSAAVHNMLCRRAHGCKPR